MLKLLAKWAAIAFIACGLLIGGALLVPTFAQNPTSEASPTAPSTQPQTPGNSTTPDAGPGQFGRMHHGRGARAVGEFKMMLVEQTIKLTGLDRADVVQQLRDGATLTAIATANGSSEQAVIDAALAQLTTRLDEAVSNGRITADQKATLLNRATTEAPTLMNQAGLNMKGGDHHNRNRGRHELIKATAEVTGLTEQEVRDQVQAGKSLAQIAQANGKTADDIIANLRTKGEIKLNEMLDRAREAIDQVPGK